MANFKQNRVLRPKDVNVALKRLQDVLKKDVGRVYSGDWNNPHYKVRGKIEDKEGLYNFEGLSLEECLDALKKIKKGDKVSFLYLECYAPEEEAKGQEEDESEDPQEGGEEEVLETFL